MKIKSGASLLSIVLLFVLNNSVDAWHSFYWPRLVVGGQVGYFRISLDEFKNLYSSKWDGIYSGQINVRIFRSNYLTVQCENYKNDNARTGFNDGESPVWQEKFYNIGVRWYSDVSRKWNFFSGLGLTFAEIKEKSGLSVFANQPDQKSTQDGQGFFLELGADYTFFPHVAFVLECEITSVGAGGGPAIIGQSFGGFAFQLGLDFYL